MIIGPCRRRRRLVGLPSSIRRNPPVRVAVAALLVAASLTVGAGPTAAAPNTDPSLQPSASVQAPPADNCAQRDRPPPPFDTSEDMPPGEAAPTPLPVPAHPVGGGRLGECGLIVPNDAPPLPSDISAGAWVIADLDTGEVLAAMDPHGRYRPASTLKLVTAHVMLNNLKDLDLVVEGTSADSDQEGTRVGLEVGGTYTVRQLLTYLLIISANDAANALARANGGYAKTVADMNATATALGALDTRAATVSGLDGPGQTTSAYDLALVTRQNMATPLFAELVATADARVPGVTNDGYIAANDNQLLYRYPGALGGKTGFTDDAGNTYVGMAARDGRRLVVSMANGTQYPRRQWMQAASLLDWGFALPAITAPVGRLVGSLAEATAVPAQPTASTGAPVSDNLAANSPGSANAPSGSAGPATSEGDTGITSSTSGGVPTALVLAGIGVLIVGLGLLLLLRRRHLNKRPTFAGDAKSADEIALPDEAVMQQSADPTGPPAASEEVPAPEPLDPDHR